MSLQEDIDSIINDEQSSYDNLMIFFRFFNLSHDLTQLWVIFAA